MRGDDRAALARDVESRLINAHNVLMLVDAVVEWRPDVVYLGNVVGLGGLALIAGLQHLGVPWVWHLGDCAPCELSYLLHATVPAIVRAFSREVSGHFLLVGRLHGKEIRTA